MIDFPRFASVFALPVSMERLWVRMARLSVNINYGALRDGGRKVLLPQDPI
jgi:hypothetical protein